MHSRTNALQFHFAITSTTDQAADNGHDEDRTKLPRLSTRTVLIRMPQPPPPPSRAHYAMLTTTHFSNRIFDSILVQARARA